MKTPASKRLFAMHRVRDEGYAEADRVNHDGLPVAPFRACFP